MGGSGGGGAYGGGGGGRNTNAAARARTVTNVEEARIKEEQALQESLHRTRKPNDGEVRENVQRVVDDLNEKTKLNATAVLGGSASKGTYVEGISDHDAVVRIPTEAARGKGPREILALLAERIRDTHPAATDVRIGRMAVTVVENGRETQYVPAVRDGRYMRFPVPGEDRWGNACQPRKFVDKLNRANARLEGAVKEAIRAFRLVQDKHLPKDQHLDGYHVESVALLAFRNYEKGKPRTKMVEDMVRAAAGILRKPVRDGTGQSLHVDDKWGAANSPERQATSHALKGLADRMKTDREEGGTFWRDLEK